MIQIIYPRDPSTEFLLKIYENLVGKFGDKIVKIHYVEATEDSYQQGVSFIQEAPANTHILFMGHGQHDGLFGGESKAFQKRPFIKRSEFGVFKDKYLFSLSCYSCELLRTSLGHSGIVNSIGFGTLPTEMIEVENNKKLASQGVNENVIQRFKDILIEIVTLSYEIFLQQQFQFGQLSNYMLLLLNRKISEVVLEDTKNVDNRVLADLLFQMKKEIVYL